MRLFGGLDGNSPTPPLPYPRDYSFKDSHNCIHHAPPSSPVFVYMSRVDGNTWTPLLIFCIDTLSKKTTKKNTFFFLYILYSRVSVLSMTPVLTHSLCPRWTEDAQEEVSIHQVPDQGTGEGVLLQRLHQQGEASAAVTDVEPDRPPGEDLVPEQEDEGEETEQRPFTVLHHKPTAIKPGHRLVLRGPWTMWADRGSTDHKNLDRKAIFFLFSLLLCRQIF